MRVSHDRPERVAEDVARETGLVTLLRRAVCQTRRRQVRMRGGGSACELAVQHERYEKWIVYWNRTVAIQIEWECSPRLGAEECHVVSR